MMADIRRIQGSPNDNCSGVPNANATAKARNTIQEAALA